MYIYIYYPKVKSTCFDPSVISLCRFRPMRGTTSAPNEGVDPCSSTGGKHTPARGACWIDSMVVVFESVQKAQVWLKYLEYILT